MGERSFFPTLVLSARLSWKIAGRRKNGTLVFESFSNPNAWPPDQDWRGRGKRSLVLKPQALLGCLVQIETRNPKPVPQSGQGGGKRHLVFQFETQTWNGRGGVGKKIFFPNPCFEGSNPPGSRQIGSFSRDLMFISTSWVSTSKNFPAKATTVTADPPGLPSMYLTASKVSHATFPTSRNMGLHPLLVCCVRVTSDGQWEGWAAWTDILRTKVFLGGLRKSPSAPQGLETLSPNARATRAPAPTLSTCAAAPRPPPQQEAENSSQIKPSK